MTPKTLFFYDLETSSFNPREGRIMQFGGQRTDLNLKKLDGPINVYIKMTEDVLPDPGAILVTGITPQKTIAEGLTEVEFLKKFHKEIATPGTIFVGYNSVRFDDEFMRYIHYRNFYDPYEWQWQDERSRWDLLDVIRMTRALRPKGFKWPVDTSGKETNRLEDVAKLNHIEHRSAHDALSDVETLIELANKVAKNQPKLFKYLLEIRQKKEIEKIVTAKKPFVYTSGKYSSDFSKTTVVSTLLKHPKDNAVLVYDLRFDPEPFQKMSVDEIVNCWKWNKDPAALRLPVKTLKFNRCPAVAPLGVLDQSSLKRLDLNLKDCETNLGKLKPEFNDKLTKALKIMDKKQQSALVTEEQSVDAQLYEDFFSHADKKIMLSLRKIESSNINQDEFTFSDKRLNTLLPLYKARMYPELLNASEKMLWQNYRKQKLTKDGQQSQINKYLSRIKEIEETTKLTDQQIQNMADLRLWGKKLVSDFV